MTTMVEKKFLVDIVYNGVTKPIQVQPEQQVTALLQKAIATFGHAPMLTSDSRRQDDFRQADANRHSKSRSDFVTTLIAIRVGAEGRLYFAPHVRSMIQSLYGSSLTKELSL